VNNNTTVVGQESDTEANANKGTSVHTDKHCHHDTKYDDFPFKDNHAYTLGDGNPMPSCIISADLFGGYDDPITFYGDPDYAHLVVGTEAEFWEKIHNKKWVSTKCKCWTFV
jgi:hypothetical protein